MRRLLLISAVGALAALSLAACGDSGADTTTVIREVERPETVEREAPATAPSTSQAASSSEQQSSAPPEPQGEPPNVLGLPLPEAQRMLKKAGYRAVAKNTDTAFGIVVPDNYTICNQGKPRGDLVVVLAQKYGC